MRENNNHDDDGIISVNSDMNVNGNDDNIESLMQNFIVISEQDVTLDTTVDNRNSSEGFMTTNSGDIPVDIQQNTNTELISGHVIFNQVGKCTMRHNKQIFGTSKERNFIQGLRSSLPGQLCPLVQPESSMYPRHFYASASNDRLSMLGARPLFLLCSKKHPYGFASALSQARIHMTNSFSTTSTDPTFMCHYFHQLGCMAMSSCCTKYSVNCMN